MSIDSTTNTKNKQVRIENTGEQDKAGGKLFSLVPASEMTNKPTSIEWILENFIEQGSLNLLFGEPGAGKSLFALDWAFCITAGLNWYDNRTKQTDVVIIAGEGFSGIQRRLKALEQKYTTKSSYRLFISQQPAQFLNGKNAELVAEEIKKKCSSPGLVIIDTLHRNMDGDENSSKDIGKFINHLDTFLKPLGAAVLIIHHSGHGNKERSRGSSSIRAAMDAEFSATNKNDLITLECHKAKDFEPLDKLEFKLNPIELSWIDDEEDDDEPMTSVYLEFQGKATNSSKKVKLTIQDEKIKALLIEISKAHGVEATDEIQERFKESGSLIVKGQRIVSIEEWRENTYKTFESDGKSTAAARMAFTRSYKKFLDVGLIAECEGYVWLIKKSWSPMPKKPNGNEQK
ncbi:AAA family ATPase [Methylomicrobium lacus]|uniref:AAA family ATPase n=1 Tax=Methylomicrobium lacus TaxID=136992 RepID=UPI0035A98FCA